jgi:hypothetical protein
MVFLMLYSAFNEMMDELVNSREQLMKEYELGGCFEPEEVTGPEAYVLRFEEGLKMNKIVCEHGYEDLICFFKDVFGATLYHITNQDDADSGWYYKNYKKDKSKHYSEFYELYYSGRIEDVEYRLRYLM